MGYRKGFQLARIVNAVDLNATNFASICPRKSFMKALRCSRNFGSLVEVTVQMQPENVEEIS